MKNVLITGAATGLGKALVEQFAERGYRVWATYRSTSLPSEWTTRFGARVQPLYMDISDEAHIQRAVNQLTDYLHQNKEQLTLIINNAAVFNPSPVLEASMTDIMATFRTNALGPTLLIQQLRPHLTPSDRRLASIINVGSYVAKVPLPFIGVYTASKTAFQALTDTLALELSIYGLKSVNVLLGMVQTGVVERQLDKIAQFSESDYLPYLRQRMTAAQQLAQKGCTAEHAAQRIFQIAHVRQPSRQYLVAKNALLLRIAAVIAPTRLYQILIKRYYFRLS
ncbi:MAG: hypothetical protein RL757_3246 [Bacteroidota bacterium]|jgi:short-subunit dehydrogenase